MIDSDEVIFEQAADAQDVHQLALTENKLSFAPGDYNKTTQGETQNDHAHRLVKICDFMYETYLEQGEKIVQLEQQTLEIENRNKTLLEDHNELEDIVEKYNMHVDLVTKELREKEQECTNLEDKNRKLESAIKTIEKLDKHFAVE